MKNRWFSFPLYREGLRQSRILMFIFLITLLISQVIEPLMTSVSTLSISNQTNRVLSQTSVTASEVLAPMWMLVYLMAPLLTLHLFGAFNHRSSSDFYHSLPYSRSSILISWEAAILTIGMGMVFIGTALGYVTYACFPDLYTLSLDGMVDIWLSYFAAMLFVVSSCLIAVSVTGSLLPNLTVSLLVVFLPRLTLFFILLMITQQVEVVDTEYFAPFLHFNYNVFFSGFEEEVKNYIYGSGFWTDNWLNDGYTLGVGVIYSLLAVWLFQRRKSETAERSAAWKVVQGGICVALCFLISLLGTYILVYLEDLIFAVIVYAIAVLAFVAYELITEKSWKKLARALPLLLLVVLLNVVTIAIVSLVVNQVKNRTPEADEIEALSLVETENVYLDGINEGRILFSDTYLDEVDIKDEATKELIATRLNEQVNHLTNESYSYGMFGYAYNGNYVVVRLTDQSGSFYRKLYLTNGDQDEAVLNNGVSKELETMKISFDLPEPDYETMELNHSEYIYQNNYLLSFTQDELKAVFQTLKEEWNVTDIQTFKSYVGNQMNGLFTLSYQDQSGQTCSLIINGENFPQTCQLILKTVQAKEQEDLALLKESLNASREGTVGTIDWTKLNADGSFGGSYSVELGECSEQEWDEMMNWLSSTIDGQTPLKNENLMLLSVYMYFSDGQEDMDYFLFLSDETLNTCPVAIKIDDADEEEEIEPDTSDAELDDQADNDDNVE